MRRSTGVIKVHTIHAEPLTSSGFGPFGQVLGPKEREPVTNRTFLEKGLVRIRDKIPAGRVSDFDVLDYWPGIADLSRDVLKLGYLRPRLRPLRFSWMERHLKGTQAFIPIGGKRSLLPVAPRGDLNDEFALPDLDEIRAFLLDGARGVNLRVGTWHWTPFPLEENAAFIILVREKAALEDLNFVDLEVRLNVSVEIVVDDPLHQIHPDLPLKTRSITFL